MSSYTLTVVDTSGIQDYIFGTNSLQQNVGASYLVDCATRRWVAEELPIPHNVNALDPDRCKDDARPFSEQMIEDDHLKAEVVYMGGGNAVIVFVSHDLAVAFARRLTCRVLLEAPGLQVVLAHKDFAWQKDALGGQSGIVTLIMNELAARKANRSLSSPILGLGVTAGCAFTGLPAVDQVDQDDDNRLISAEVLAKLRAEPLAHARLKGQLNLYDYAVPKRFDELGHTEKESSYIAVVHTDGNGMARRIQGIRDDFPTAGHNRQYVRAMRAFSQSVEAAAIQALQSTVDRLCESVDNGKIGDTIKLQENKLPFRPIVFGGDDVTFVCDGRLGLSLAAHYLKQFSSQILTDKSPAYCRAGVAVVKMHYPFARAYALADELCRSAKEYIRQREQPPFDEKGLTAMDWHFAVSGLVERLKETRAREYSTPAGSLLMRPVRVTDPEKDWPSWNMFSSIVNQFQSGEEWAERRNKVMSLRETLRAGPDAVRHFLSLYRLDELPSIPSRPDMEKQGWQDGRCGYFDAIEAMDFLIPLKGGSL